MAVKIWISQVSQQQAKKYKHYARVIELDEIFADAYTEKDETGEARELTPRERRTRIKNVALYLDHLKANGEITGYTEKRGLKNRLIGYEITP